MSLLIRNATVVLSTGCERMSVLVEGSKIAALWLGTALSGTHARDRTQHAAGGITHRNAPLEVLQQAQAPTPPKVTHARVRQTP